MYEYVLALPDSDMDAFGRSALANSTWPLIVSLWPSRMIKVWNDRAGMGWSGYKMALDIMYE